MWPMFLTAIALLLLFEGLLPFISPQLWRQLMINLVSKEDHAIRIMGLISLLAGVGLMVLVHSGIIF